MAPLWTLLTMYGVSTSDEPQAARRKKPTAAAGSPLMRIMAERSRDPRLDARLPTASLTSRTSQNVVVRVHLNAVHRPSRSEECPQMLPCASLGRHQSRGTRASASPRQWLPGCRIEFAVGPKSAR